MKTAIVLLMTLFFVGLAAAEEYTVTPRFQDLSPNDGIMEEGSNLNPYEVYDQNGNQVGTMRPRFYDSDPNDGFMDPGSRLNPYEIQTD